MFKKFALDCLMPGLMAGLFVGAIVGTVESHWHISTLGASREFSALYWAPAMYGLVFALLGLGAAVVLAFFYLVFGKLRKPVFAFGLSRGGRTMVAAGGVGGYAILIVAGVMLSTVKEPSARGSAFKPQRGTTAPNIILVAIDALRADYLDVYTDAAPASTPNISSFAEDSIVFQNTFAQSSSTKASFGTIFSGMYPEAHRATGEASSLPDEIKTVAEVLRDAGYYTKGFSNSPNIRAVFNYGQGYVSYVDLEPEFYFGAKGSSEGLALYGIFRKAVHWVDAKTGGRIRISDFYQPANSVTDHALEWMDSPERPVDSPFFLFLHYMDPHDPFRDPARPGKGFARVHMPNPDPEKYLDAMRRSYVHEVEFMDTHVGRLFDALKSRGIYEDSLIVFTSDHGEEFYEHGGWWHGLSLYEEQLAVPLIVKLPGNQYGGLKNPFLARHVDLAPTFAQFAGRAAPTVWQGRSLFDAELQPGNTSTEYIYAHLDFEGILLRALRTTGQKLILANEGNAREYEPFELYDLEGDPAEQLNIADEPASAETLQQYSDMIDGMVGFVLENRAEPVLSDKGTPESEESLEDLGYLGG